MDIQQVGAFEAKTRLSELLERVRCGQVFRITRRGKPIAELRPIAELSRRPRFGADKDRVSVRGDFEAPVADLQRYTR